jgi:hypothetical protein
MCSNKQPVHLTRLETPPSPGEFLLHPKYPVSNKKSRKEQLP